MQQSSTARRPQRIIARYGKRFSMVLAVGQYRELESLADQYELSMSELVRRSVALGLPLEAKRLKRLGGGGGGAPSDRAEI